jgi:phospholipid/cholesterol/gamma-HCH transport system substrate-binding protein
MRHPQSGLRHVHRRSGLVVLIAMGIFIVAILQAGVIGKLFTDTLSLRVILPESGLNGLSAGAEVEVLGTRAGEVERIVIDPEASFYAEVMLDPSMEPFIRQDSQVFIRKQFGIAGAAYLEITRGRSFPLDWDFAVLQAAPDSDTSVNVNELVEELRGRIIPIIEDSQRAIRAVTALVEKMADPVEGLPATLDQITRLSDRVAAGEGTVGRLLTDDTLLRQLETTVGELNKSMSSISAIIANLETTTGEVASMAQSFGEQSERIPELVKNAASSMKSLDKVMADASLLSSELAAERRRIPELVESAASSMKSIDAILADSTQISKGLAEQSDRIPEMIENTNAALTSIKLVLEELSRAMPGVAELASNSADATLALPSLLAQTQNTLSELEKLLISMQGSWLFGGNPPPPEPERLSPLEVRP